VGQIYKIYLHVFIVDLNALENCFENLYFKLVRSTVIKILLLTFRR
jgi:hypothetical protein